MSDNTMTAGRVVIPFTILAEFRPRAAALVGAAALLGTLLPSKGPAARRFDQVSPTEPSVRIGIVLPEDNRRKIDFQLPDKSRFRIAGGATTSVFQVTRATTCTAELVGSKVRITVQAVQPRSVEADRVTVSPIAPQSLDKGAGLVVRQVVAGRIFHWRKEIDQTLLGSLQFIPWGDRLILVNELPVEQYLAGVITAEMSGECPIEFLKAQTIAARTWYFGGSETSKHPGMPFARCNDDCCQRYQGTGDLSPVAMRAIDETRGMLLVADNVSTLIQTNYSKSCGGIMADPERVWGSTPEGQYCGLDAPEHSTASRFFPITDQNAREWFTGDWLKTADIYCGAAVVPERDLHKYLGRVDVAESYFRWTVKYSRAELADLLRKKVPLPDLEDVIGINPGTRGPSGHLYDLTIRYRKADGGIADRKINGQYAIRQVLHPSFLYSSAFIVDATLGPDGLPKEFVLRGGGWGHGAGLCQIGALGMALKGRTCNEILAHYFRHCTVRQRYR